MIENKLVSVIVPIYNVDKYLEKCIESIRNQTYKNLEIILVDDGSPDTSGNICDKYAQIDNRIKVIHKKNAGVSAARNDGLENASGEYVCFVDGDDYVMPDYVEYLYGLMCNNEVDIALTTEMFDNYQLNQVHKDEIQIFSGEDATVGILCYRIPIGVYCKLFKKELLDNKVRFLTDIFIGEGFNFNTTAFQYAERIAVGNRRIYFYRKDNATSATTHFSLKKWENGIMAIDRIKQNFILHSKRIEKAWEYARWHTYADVYTLMLLAGAEQQYREMYKLSKKITQKGAICAVKVNISVKERIKALIMMICPSFVPKMINLRRKKHRIKV